MRIGICLFIESNLGGAATQADDLVSVARRLGHESCLLRFTISPRSRGLWSPGGNGLPSHQLVIGRSGIRFTGERVHVPTGAGSKNLVRWLNTFDLLVFVGGCPHLTRTFSENDFLERFLPIYRETTCRKIIFLTDPFWRRLYPYLQTVVKYVDQVYAFAEAYQREASDPKLGVQVEICNFGSVAASDLALSVRPNQSRSNEIIWPHQWRSWKNPLLMVRTVPELNVPVRAYADGIEYHLIRRDHREDWDLALAEDYTRPQKGPGKLYYHGTVPQKVVLDQFIKSRWMLDLTGMSGRTGKQLEKFVGNYQCVNIESMMLGCVTLKYENTIYPYSQIPENCVCPLPLTADPGELAAAVNSVLTNDNYRKVSQIAREWALEHFLPEKVFRRKFLEEKN